MSSAKKRKRRRAAQKNKKRGVMTGMRGGFKNLAANMTGQETAKKKKNAWIGTVITVVLLAAAAALLYQRFG